MIKRFIVLGLAVVAGLLICSKDEHMDTDPDGGFYDWYRRLP